MPMEVQVAATWLYGQLSGDSTLVGLVGGAVPRIFLDYIPDGAAMPAVVFNHQAGNDLQIPGPTRVWSDQVWQVKAVSEGMSLGPLNPIVDRIEVVLHGRRGAAAGGTVHGCIRETTVSYAEVDEGSVFRHLGGLWRMYVTAAPAA